MENSVKRKSKEEFLESIRQAKERLNRNLANSSVAREARLSSLPQNSSVQDRLKSIALHKEDSSNSLPPKDIHAKDINLGELVKRSLTIAEELKKNGVDIEKSRSLSEGKDDLDKDKSKDKDEKDKKKEKEKEANSPEKQEEKAKAIVSKVKLPSGMEIHEEANKYVLVSKNGQSRTDVTDIMSKIDKFNRDIDDINKENDIERNVQSNANEAASKAQSEGTNKADDAEKFFSTDQEIEAVTQALPAVKDVDGNQLIPDEDLKSFAEYGVKEAEDKLGRDLLEEAHDRDDKNNKRGDKKVENAVVQAAIRNKINQGKE